MFGWQQVIRSLTIEDHEGVTSILITPLDRNGQQVFELICWLGLLILACFFKFDLLVGYGGGVVD
jgi:hypothetical protein